MRFTEIYTFLFSISLVCFLSMLYLWPAIFTLEWKTNSHLVFLVQKNLKRTGVSSILAATIIGHFSGIFRIHSSSISAYSWRLKDNTLFSESISDVKSLSIYYSSSTGESRVNHWGWKGSGRYSDADYNNHVVQTLTNLTCSLHFVFLLLYT